MQRKIRTLFFLSVFTFTSAFAQTIEITPGTVSGLPADEFAAQVLQNSDFEVVSVTFAGDETGLGSFLTEGESPIGVSHGLVLSTGKTEDIPGVAATFVSTGLMSDVNNPDLEMLSNEDSLFDLNQVTVEFIPYTDTLVIDFVFGSEEYPEYTCSPFNDKLGIFLTGPGINGPFSNNGVNISVLPDSDTPISINNIHPGLGTGCEATNEEYYIDNMAVQNPLTLDGYTTVIPIRYPVIPFETYQMTLVIADAADAVFDTAAFLQFSDCVNGFCRFFDPERAALPETCEPANVYLDLSNADPSIFPFEVTLGGTAENGTDYETLQTTYTLTAANPVLDFDIVPIPDEDAEGTETLELSVSAAGEYVKSVHYVLEDDFTAEALTETLSCGTYTLSLEETTGQEYAFTNSEMQPIAPYNSYVISEIEVADVPFPTLHNINLIKEVCINVEHPWLDDLNVYLVAPNGKRIVLTTDNGINGDDYLNTCFTPTAIRNIASNAQAENAPFSGDWQPEGDWNDLRQTSVNGTWQLLIYDDAEGFAGELTGWSITFHDRVLYSDQIVWSTGETGVTVEYAGELPAVVTAQIADSACGQTYTFELPEIPSEAAVLYIEESICDDSDFSVIVNGTVYDADNPVGTEVIEGGTAFGCDSIIEVNLQFAENLTEYLIFDYAEGESITVAGTVIDAEGYYEFTETDEETGCDYNIFASFLSPPPAYTYDVFAADEMTVFTNCEPDFCLNIQPYHAQPIEVFLDGTSIGNVADFPTCETVTERVFNIPGAVINGTATWRIAEIGGQSNLSFPFHSADAFLHHLHYLRPEAEFHLENITAVPKIITRSATDIETIVLIEINDETQMTLPGVLLDRPVGALLPVNGDETELVLQPVGGGESSTFTLDFNLEINPTAETVNTEVQFSTGVDEVTIEETFEFAELCGEISSITDLCPSDFLNLEEAVLADGELSVVIQSEFNNLGSLTEMMCLEVCSDQNLCDTLNIEILYDFNDATVDYSLSDEVNIYPNPAADRVALSLTDPDNRLLKTQIFSAAGKMLREVNLSAQNSFSVARLPQGVYWMLIETDKGKARKRLVVMR